MNDIIKSTLITLKKTKKILSILNDESLGNSTIPPYKSSIGSHIRHILDFYDCILNTNSKSVIDLTIRKRDLLVETNCISAFNYYEDIMNKLKINDFNLENHVLVIDDLGNGKIKIKYTFGALLSQANSHTIHHYAIINYILEGLKISIDDSDFGYNPTTPKQISLG
ncbi:MAG: hypothetical protein K9I95_04730 [Flavobacteriaceae bacterium]|nr:hypothetical protein [Flavobacteriaceae bacterium]